MNQNLTINDQNPTREETDTPDNQDNLINSPMTLTTEIQMSSQVQTGKKQK